MTDTEEVAGRGCSTRRSGLALWLWGAPTGHRSTLEASSLEESPRSKHGGLRALEGGSVPTARRPLPGRLSTSRWDKKPEAQGCPPSIFSSPPGLWHWSHPRGSSLPSDSVLTAPSYCCFPAPACLLILTFLLDTGSREGFSDISRQMLTESSARPMLSDHTVAPPTSRITDLSPHRGAGEK